MLASLSDFEKELIAFLQGDIPLSARPYQEIARKWGLSEEDIVEKIQFWLDTGLIRRYTAVLRHRQAGYNVNAMVAWKTAPEDADDKGRIMAEFTQVSHCYLREGMPDFPYNLYTMVHSRSAEELDDLVRRLEAASGLREFQVLETEKELKKVSMKYV